MWSVETATGSASGGWEIWPSRIVASHAFSDDLAPDGRYYGVGPASCSNGTLTWGTMDPDAVYGGTPPTLISPLTPAVPYMCATASFQCRFMPVTFINDVPDPGAPVGYRLEQREETGGRVSNGAFMPC